MTKLCRVNSALHLGRKESAESIVSDLVRENATIVLDIQKQLVDDQLIFPWAAMYRREGQTNVRCRKPGKSGRSTINRPTSSGNLKLAARDSI